MAGKEFTTNTNFKPEGYPTFPYENAKKEWDDRIGNARVQAKHWRYMALGTLLICFYLLYINHDITSKSRITPYVVDHGRDGSAVAIGPAIRMNFMPAGKEIKFFLGQFVQKTRSLPLDPVVAKNNWLVAYRFLTQSGTAKMNQYVKDKDPFLNIGKEMVDVKINVIVPLSKDSYQVRWQEDVFTNQGALIKRYQMTGLFTVTFSEPTTEEEIMYNPLGLYIKDFSWDKDIQNSENEQENKDEE